MKFTHAAAALAAFMAVAPAFADDARRPVATVSMSSLRAATDDISDALTSTGLGTAPARELAKATVARIMLVPDPDCADRTLPAIAAFLPSGNGDELPEQVAVVPLSPINGIGILRDSLKKNYARTEGSQVVFCSEPTGDGVPPSLAVLVAKDFAYVAETREGLKWMVQRHNDGVKPLSPQFRGGEEIHVTLDPDGAAKVLDSLLAGISPADAGTESPAFPLFLLRDFLGGVASFGVSLDAGLSMWHVSAHFDFAPENPPSKFLAAPPIDSSGLLGLIPNGAAGMSASMSAALASLLPDTPAWRGNGSSLPLFCGTDVFPGREAESRAVAPFLSGESASCFLFNPGGGVAARVSAFRLADPAGAAAALAKAFPDGARHSETAGDFFVCGDGGADDKVHGRDYVIEALAVLSEFGNVEAAIVNGCLLTVAGPAGSLEKVLEAPKMRVLRHPPSVSGLRRQGSGAVLLGFGNFEPSRVLGGLAESKPGLVELRALLPRYGGGIGWSVSRQGGEAVFEARVSATEALALAKIWGAGRKRLGDAIAGGIIGAGSH